MKGEGATKWHYSKAVKSAAPVQWEENSLYVGIKLSEGNSPDFLLVDCDVHNVSNISV